MIVKQKTLLHVYNCNKYTCKSANKMLNGILVMWNVEAPETVVLFPVQCQFSLLNCASPMGCATTNGQDYTCTEDINIESALDAVAYFERLKYVGASFLRPLYRLTSVLYFVMYLSPWVNVQ